MDWTKLWPTVIPLIAVVANAFSDQIAAFITAHPTLSLLLMTVSTALGNLTKSPTAPKS